MADGITIAFGPLGPVGHGDIVLFVGDDLALSPAVAQAVGRGASDLVARAAASERFKGKSLTSLALPAPAGLDADRLLVIGLGSEKDRAKIDWPALGGYAASKLSGRQAHVALDWPGASVSPANAADFALGARLRVYSFDRYKTKKKPEGEEGRVTALTLMVGDPSGAEAAAKQSEAVAGGVLLARELINEPPNVLYPEEFARRAEELTKLGVEVEVLGPGKLEALGMGALLAVAQGSTREARVVVMRWNGGADASEAPIAFIGKGVCFDSGGISIKSAGGMEDMKGDMGGAACVVGTMFALASRKAKVNAIGAIGIVENMPDGGAMRPADIVTSMSGQTIEIINTDAEGRLVLADVILARAERLQAEIHDRSGDAHRRDHRRPRPGHRRHVLERRRACRQDRRRQRGDRRGGVADAADPGLRQGHRFEVRRHEEHRRPPWRRGHRRLVHQALRQRRSLGPSRHRRRGDVVEPQ